MGKRSSCLFLFTNRRCSGAMKPKHLGQLDGVLTSHPGGKGSRAFFQAGMRRQAQVGTASSPKPFCSLVRVLGRRGIQGLEESVDGWQGLRRGQGLQRPHFTISPTPTQPNELLKCMLSLLTSTSSHEPQGQVHSPWTAPQGHLPHLIFPGPQTPHSNQTE